MINNGYPLRFTIQLLLLIIIMISASCIQKPHAMDAFLKQDSVKLKNTKPAVPSDRTLTLCLGQDNKVLYYRGDLDKPLEGPAITGYGKDSLGKILINDLRQFSKDTSKYLNVLIKPSDKSTYQDFLKALDLINTYEIKSYGVVDITPGEVAMLKKQDAYK
jgi:biopolymer transport protein ExbD